MANVAPPSILADELDRQFQSLNALERLRLLAEHNFLSLIHI
mgnify:CR=1 FL=1